MVASFSRKASSPDMTDTTPAFSLEGLRRVRTQEFAQLLGIGRSSFFSALKSGRVPPADGRDCGPYWYVKTVHRVLTATNQEVAG